MNRVEYLSCVSYLKGISNCLRTNWIWIFNVIAIESWWDYKAVNPYSKAYGLIQFMPQTLKSMGITDIKKVDIKRQLDYVYQYYKPFKYKLNSFVDCYLAVFYPVAMGKDDDYVLGEKNNRMVSLIAKQNYLYDLNFDGKITKGEITGYFKKKFPKIEVEPIKIT